MIQNCHSRYKKKKKKIGLETRKKLASNDNNFVILCFGGSRASGKKNRPYSYGFIEAFQLYCFATRPVGTPVL